MEEKQRILRLPFEFNNTDNLGPWDVLLSEDAVRDMRQLESIETIELVMNTLRHISSGAWNKYKKVSSHNIPVYEVVLSGSGIENLKILWNVDYEFSIRCFSHTQLVKIWAVSSNPEQVQKVLDNLEIVHNAYTEEHNNKCEIFGGENTIVLPKIFDEDRNNVILSKKFEDAENSINTNEDNEDFGIDDDKMLEVHKMLVTNKFFPFSKV
jgi:hypothetical protein